MVRIWVVARATLVAGAVTACGGGGGGGASNDATPRAAEGQPTVSLALSSAKASAGVPVELSWTSTNASSCVAAGSWAGAQPTTGKVSVHHDEGGRFDFQLTCNGPNGATTGHSTLTVPMKVWPTSYENKTRLAVATTALPNVWDPSMDLVRAGLPADERSVGPRALAFGDFFQDGSYAVVNSTMRYVGAFPGNNPDQWADSPGMLVFLKKGHDGMWTNNTAELIPNEADRRTCISSSFTIVADFNNDKRPDIYAACHGIDFQVAGEWRDTDSEQFVFLSQPDGRYKRTVLPIGKIYGHQATAADIDGDGNVDVITTDVGVNRAPFVLWGNGDGTFRVDKTRMPAEVSGRDIYGVMLIPIAGRLNLILSGSPAASFPDAKPPASRSYGKKLLTYEGGQFRNVLDLTDNLPLTTSGLAFSTGLDYNYRAGHLYSLHVNYAAMEEAIIKTDLTAGNNVVVYRGRADKVGERFELFNINQANEIEVYGAVCNIYDGSPKPICALRIPL